MSRHEFRPGKLLAGLALFGTSLCYLGDAAGWWHTAWFVVIPMVCGGLFLSAAVAGVGYVVRHRASGGRRHRGAPPGADAGGAAGGR
ncbi:hypothetical protein HUT18_22220 [Streptomyces sp. NA04227]|uniref:hypothetical protein n=1 Tax=Streptomyces sp. NA04227 TaxID=2742136 RepID=UPI001590EA03|nr:hypothetical protein [Streptomyces sp. NA04227]QKW08685.1 hypothetical protein HUT18_22220 [Streptomyces sp. NA04227]